MRKQLLLTPRQEQRWSVLSVQIRYHISKDRSSHGTVSTPRPQFPKKSSTMTKMSEPPSSSPPPPEQVTLEYDQASNALSECLFAQYQLTVSGVAAGTGYALYKKLPSNTGIGTMLVAGAAGTLADLAYGWNKACQPQVQAWRRLQQQMAEQEQKR